MIQELENKRKVTYKSSERENIDFNLKALGQLEKQEFNKSKNNQIKF